MNDRKKLEESNLPTTEECDKEIWHLHETINKNQEEYDKQLLTLSTGFLVITLAFVKDVVPLEAAVHICVLYWAYISLGLCIVLVLVSYQVSIRGHFKAKDYWEDKKKAAKQKTIEKEPAEKKNADFPDGYVRVIKCLNIFSGIVFILGLFLTVGFVISNLQKEGSLSEKRTSEHVVNIPCNGESEQRGSYIKQPPTPPPAEKPAKNTASNQENKKN